MKNRTLPIAELFLLALFVITFPLVAYVSTLPVARFRNEITQWGSLDTTTYQQFVDYREKFGDNEYVVVSWPGCDLKDERVLEVSDRIAEELAGKVSQVFNGQAVYWTLRDGTGLSDSGARRRMRGLFIGEDDETTAIAFGLTDTARMDRAPVMEKLSDILRRSDVDPEKAYFAGLAHNLYTLDKEGLESPFRMVPQIMLLALLLTFAFIRHFWLALFINALGVYTGCLAFNFIYLADIDMNAILWPLPTLTMLLTVSAALHFLSYVRKAIADASPAASDETPLWRSRRMTSEAFALAWKPMLFCAITTAIGLASLQLSTSSPVRQFGLYGGISIVAACALTLLWLPAFLTVIKYYDRKEVAPLNVERTFLSVDSNCGQECPHDDIGLNAAGPKGGGDAPSVTRPIGAQPGGWMRLAWFTRTFRWPIIIVSLVGLVVMGAGVPKIKTGSNVQNFFPMKHRVLTDLATIENSTGPLSSVELLLRFSDPKRSNDKSRLKGLRALSSKIVESTCVHSCVSAATFAPVWKKRTSAVQEIGEIARLRRLKEEIPQIGLLHVVPSSADSVSSESGADGTSVDEADNVEETWRISCRYYDVQPQDTKHAGSAVDLPHLCAQLRSITTELFLPEDHLVFEGESLEIITTGEFVLFEEVDRQFFSELMKTYLTAFVLISIVVLLILRTPLGLLLALPPNLFPAVMVLGAAGHFGYALDAASLMTASVALGIAVDDTLHFMLWWKDGRAADKTDGDKTQGEPIEQAIRYSGTAMIQTSFIIGLSIVLYAFCGFLPTVRFGLLLSGMMLAALVGDLILLPALLATQAKRLKGA